MELALLITGAVTIAFLHTLLGPDHYLPFIVLSKARNWKLKKTLFWTLICGIGHLLSSVVLAILAIFLTINFLQIDVIEGFRGDITAWFLMVFGLVYAVIGLREIFASKNSFFHSHAGHLHHHKKANTNITLWALFIIFVFGPCEPLIPLVIYPALSGDWISAVLVSVIFSFVTLVTMLGIVLISYGGFKKLSFLNKYQKYFNFIAGIIILLCGFAIKYLGL